MTIAKRRSEARNLARLAGKMADAVTYLSSVAEGAGMEAISADLLSIRERLAQEAPSTSRAAKRRKTRGPTTRK